MFELGSLALDRTAVDGVEPEGGDDFWLEIVGAIDGEGLSDERLVAELTALERLTSGAAAAKARLTAELHTRRTSDAATAGVPAARRAHGVANEVALARRESPHAGREHLSLGVALVGEMPETLAALSRGDINEYVAQLMVRETADLSREDRMTVDATLGPQLSGRGNREIVGLVRRMAYELDTEGAEARARAAKARRRVSCRALGNGMSRVSGDLPALDAIAAFQSLRDHADQLRAMGDERTRDQIMADEFAERLDQPVLARARRAEIQLVMNGEMVLGADRETPAHLVGYGPLPFGVAADFLADPDAEVFVRRLFTNPDDNSLVAMDSKGIVFHGGLRRLLFARDGETCRTPWCDAPVRHGDHVRPRARGGRTTLDGGQGLCEACNYAKEAPGWRHETRSRWPERHTTEITTPTRHTHWSQAPPLPVQPSPHHPLRRHLAAELYYSNVSLELDLAV
ncbi:MAG: endonuclease [Nocardioides sp.]|nr:endonuclease [Nocardioides sp.]